VVSADGNNEYKGAPVKAPSGVALMFCLRRALLNLRPTPVPALHPWHTRIHAQWVRAPALPSRLQVKCTENPVVNTTVREIGVLRPEPACGA